MLKIALITNFNITEKANAAMQVAAYLLREGGEILIAALPLRVKRWSAVIRLTSFRIVESQWSLEYSIRTTTESRICAKKSRTISKRRLSR